VGFKKAIYDLSPVWHEPLWLLCLLILAVDLSACSKLVGKGTINSDANAAGTIGVKQVSITVDQNAGTTSATISGNAAATQLVQVPETSPIAGTSLTIQPGTLGVTTDVTIELAAPLVNPGNTAALGMDGGSTIVGKAVSIQPTQPVDALRPFTVALAVPSGSGLNVADLSTNLYVMYKVRNVQKGTVTLGLIPRSALTVSGGILSFSISFFGAYQAAVSLKPITEAVQVAVASAPILTQHASAALPPLAVTARSPFMVGAGSTVTITGKNFRPTMTLAIGGRPVANLKVADESSASFTVPTYQGFGLSSLTADQDGSATQSAVVYYTGTYADYPVSSKAVSEVCAGDKFYDSTGTLQTGTRNCTIPAACTADGYAGCLSSASFPAAQAAGLASKVLSGSKVAGVAGNVTLPSVSNVLTTVAYGASGISSVGTLTLPTAANVRATNGTFGAGGTATTPTLADCSSDGQTGCVTSGMLPAAAITGFSTWNIRAGTTLAGLSGTLKTNCRSAVSSAYNYDGAVGSLPATAISSGTAFDYWDTTDDYSGIAANKVTAWSSATYCDSSTWTDVTTTNGGTSNVVCGTSSTCIYRDQITNLQVTGILSSGSNTTNTGAPATNAWSAAVNACAGSTYGGYAAGTWRLPTQKELLSLYEHGIVSLVSANFMTLANMQGLFWSSSTASAGTTSAWIVLLARGESSNGTAKTTALSVSCVQSGGS